MQKIGQSLALLAIGLSSSSYADYDYFESNRQMIRNGVQAVLSCNGLFTSNRSVDQVFQNELAYLGDRVIGDASGGNYSVNTTNKRVGVGVWSTARI